jgi:hypothetical protein
METTKVKMKCESLGEEREFDLIHAEALLNYQVKYKLSDWQISDPNFTFENATIKRANIRTSKESEKQTGDSESY